MCSAVLHGRHGTMLSDGSWWKQFCWREKVASTCDDNSMLWVLSCAERMCMFFGLLLWLEE